MKNLSYKNKTLITLGLILLMSLSTFVFVHPINAAAPAIPVWLYVAPAPNPIGVGQTWVIYWQIDKLVPTYPNGTVSPQQWTNVVVHIQLPDGTAITSNPLTSASNAAGAFYYTPTQVGNYTVWAVFPGETLDINGLTYLPATSDKVQATVQQQAIPSYPSSPLPTNYWTRPINGNNREWSAIGGNWLNIYPNQVNDYTTGPESAHIMWTKPLDVPGGIIGGEYGSESNFAGLWYWPRFTNPIIIEGRLYYRTIDSAFAYNGTACIDLRTGQQIWDKPNVLVTIGQIFYQGLGDIHGGASFLWSATGTTWSIYSTYTGDLVCSLSNATTGGTLVTGPSGELLYYFFNSARTNLLRWNSSAVTALYTTSGNVGVYQWTPGAQGNSGDWRTGIDMNWTITKMPGTQSISKISDGIIYARANFNLPNMDVIPEDMAYDQASGALLWGPTNRTEQPAPAAGTALSVLCAGEGVFIDVVQQTFQIDAYNMRTGALMWTSLKTSQQLWDYYTRQGRIDYGLFFLTSFSGHTTAYNLTTGKVVWDWYSGSSGFETSSGNWEFSGKFIVADGKIYAAQGDVEPYNPDWRGYKLICLNATTGNVIWENLNNLQVNGAGNMVLADGYLAGFDQNDEQIYCYGKGPSATTVTAPNVGVTTSTPIVISGKVTDISAGSTQNAVAANFPSGLPCVSDASESQFMQAVYEQQPMPTNATGVPVTISVFDPNNNTYVIGTATSDITGSYAISWTPPVPGLYTVTATFAGSKSYYSSSSETHVTAAKALSISPQASAVPASPTAPSTAPPTTTLPTTVPTQTIAPTPSPVVIPPATATPTATYIAIGIAIVIIVAVAAAITLRKRK